MNKWLIIGVSGVTCGGKTTIANELNNIFPKSSVVCQDEYFLPVDDPRHKWIKELNHINFDILSSLDMEKMYSDIQKLLINRKNINDKHHMSKFSKCNILDLQQNVRKKVNDLQLNILIIEGFCIFNYKPIEQLCDLKYFLTLNHDECLARRTKRVYEPPDCPGYFELCVWPEYLKLQQYVIDNVKDVTYFSEFTKDPIKQVLCDIQTLC